MPDAPHRSPADPHKTRPLAGEALRFLAVGAAATALQYVILVSLVVTVWNFALNCQWSFRPVGVP